MKDGVVVEVLQRPPVQVIHLLSAKTQTAHRARPAATRMLQPEHRTQQAHCSVLAWCSMEARGNTNHEHHKHLLRLFSSSGVGVVGGIHCSGSSLAAGATERCQLRQQATGPQLHLEPQCKAYASAKFFFPVGTVRNLACDPRDYSSFQKQSRTRKIAHQVRAVDHLGKPQRIISKAVHHDCQQGHAGRREQKPYRLRVLLPSQRSDKEFHKEGIEARSTHALGPRTTITLPPFYHGTTTSKDASVATHLWHSSNPGARQQHSRGHKHHAVDDVGDVHARLIEREQGDVQVRADTTEQEAQGLVGSTQTPNAVRIKICYCNDSGPDVVPPQRDPPPPMPRQADTNSPQTLPKA